MRFGRLYVYDRAPNKGGNTVWLCVCDCANEIKVRGSDLGKHTNSCGCLNVEIGTERHYVDGRTKHPLYITWVMMIRRCHNPKSDAFNNYGGRMIFVCDEWRNDFWKFVVDIGPRPTVNHTVERVDNNAGYSKDNCIWATRLIQRHNRRDTQPCI